LFYPRSKPTPPRIITTANELRGNPNHKPEIRVTDIPNDTTAKIKLVMGGTDGDHDPEIIHIDCNKQLPLIHRLMVDL
jgi:hypothetical protein